MHDILTVAQIRAFQDDGFLVVRDFMPRATIARCLADLSAFLSGPRADVAGINPKHIVNEVDDVGVKYAESVDHYVPSIKLLMDLKLLRAASELLGGQN